VPKNIVVRRIFEPKRNEAIGGCINVNDYDFHKLHSLLIIIKMIESKRTKLEEHVSCMGAKMNTIGNMTCLPNFGLSLGTST
jgi:hypothetical protein